MKCARCRGSQRCLPPRARPRLRRQCRARRERRQSHVDLRCAILAEQDRTKDLVRFGLATLYGVAQSNEARSQLMQDGITGEARLLLNGRDPRLRAVDDLDEGNSPARRSDVPRKVKSRRDMSCAETGASLTLSAVGSRCRATTAKQSSRPLPPRPASLQVRAMRQPECPTPCKTVGSAYVGSNPTPATSQNSSSARCRVCDPASGSCRQMPRNAVVCRWSWDIRGMIWYAAALSSAEVERGFDPGVGEVLALVQAFGVDAQ
jgi:hypothetical protein